MAREPLVGRDHDDQADRPRAPTRAVGADPLAGRALQLQARAGNAAVSRLIAARSGRRLDRMSFTRLAGWSWPLSPDATERQLLQLETDLEDLIDRTEPWGVLKLPRGRASRVLDHSRAATLAPAGYAAHAAGLQRAIADLNRQRDQAWDSRALHMVEGEAASVDRNAATVNHAAAEGRLRTAVGKALNGVPPVDVPRRVADLRGRAPRVAAFAPHVGDLLLAALVSFDPDRTAFVAAHAPATTNLIAGPAIEQAGGAAQIPKLTRLLTITRTPLHPGGNWARLGTLLATANGNAAAFDRLYHQIDTFHRNRAVVATAPPLPGGLPQPATVTSRRVAYGPANMPHFLERHTYDWFDFNQIANQQGFWPEGTTPADIAGYLEEALLHLHPAVWFAFARASLPARTAWVPIAPFAIGSGFNVRVGIGTALGVVPTERVGQFYPVADGVRVISLTRADMNIIRVVLGV